MTVFLGSEIPRSSFRFESLVLGLEPWTTLGDL